jgi:plastocyanin
MRNKVKGFWILIAIMFCMLSIYAVQTVQGADETVQPQIQHKVVRLYEKGGVNPETLIVDRGTTVIWINDSKSIAEIEFTDKKVTLVCKSPIRFAVDESGTYVSDKIFQGAVASLCFIEQGEFDYLVKREPRRLATTPTVPPDVKGKIIVK